MTVRLILAAFLALSLTGIALPPVPAAAESGLGAQIAFDRPETKASLPDVPPMTFAAPDQKPGKPFSTRYVATGQNVSPPLSWSDAPAQTKSFVLLVEAPDAGQPTPLVLWLAYNIPAQTTGLAHSVRNIGDPTTLLGMLQGWNDHGSLGYTGPRPPPGGPAQRFVFQLFALDRTLGLHAGAHRDQVLRAMRGHVLTKANFTILYAEPAPKLKMNATE
jgi:Raf kinase inhibitor-like YbhB/YbcL family protein